MIRLLGTTAVALGFMFSAGILLIRAQPYDDGGLYTLLLPPDGCPAPCWMGIQPGLTTMDAAVAGLKANPNIELMETSSTQMHFIHFSAAQNAIRWAKLYFWRQGSSFDQMTLLEPDIKPGDFFLTMGEPEAVIAYNPIQFDPVSLLVIYTQYDMSVSMNVYLCLGNQESFWKEAEVVSISVGDRQKSDVFDYVYYGDPYPLNPASWATEVRTLRDCR